MRNLDSLIVFLLFVVCAEQLIAQPPVNVQQRQQRYRQLLQRFDVDGNGQLDPSEKQALQRFVQQRNGNNPTQRIPLQRPQQIPMPQMRPENQPQQRPNAGQRPGNRQRREGFLFQPRKRQDKLDKTRLLIRFDANRDGQLSAAERAAAIEAMSQ